MAIVFLSLGSNLGDRLSYVQQAASILGMTNNIQIIATSSFYETEPWQMDTPNWFVNAIVQISTSLSPEELLIVINRIEAQLGRERSEKRQYTDRTIDIDILFYDDKLINTDKLVIPHRFFHRRACMLVPMLEIAQDFIHPLFKKSISDLMNLKTLNKSYFMGLVYR